MVDITLDKTVDKAVDKTVVISMDERFSRTSRLIGEDTLLELKDKKVAVFGLGGVGSYVAEALVRAGIGRLLLIDMDVVCASNINRQLIALTSTLGQPKVLVAKSRYLDINPDIQIETHELFYIEKSKDQIDLSDCDYIVDAIDTITAKILLITEAKSLNIPIISSLGTGNKIEGKYFKIDDIAKTSVCPLARIMRKQLKRRGISDVKVLYSTEEPLIREREPASISFVPSVAGLLIAGEVVRDMIAE